MPHCDPLFTLWIEHRGQNRSWFVCVLFSKATVEIKDITSNTKRLIYIEQIQMHYLKQHIQTVRKTLPVYK